MDSEINKMCQQKITTVMLDEFAPNFHLAVRHAVERTRAGNEQEIATFSTTVESHPAPLGRIFPRMMAPASGQLCSADADASPGICGRSSVIVNQGALLATCMWTFGRIPGSSSSAPNGKPR
jgi:hypothetical protein